MPGGRKGKTPKIDGAYQDLVLKPIPGSDEYRGYTNQEEQISAVGGPPPGLQQQVAATGGMPRYKPEDIFAKPTERINESGLADTQPQQIVELPPATDTQILIELIKEKAPITAQRF